MAYVVVTGKIIADSTGASMEMPVLLSPSGVVIPLVDYLLSVRRSMSWRDKLVHAVKLFLEYVESSAQPGAADWTVLRNFSNCLSLGTVDTKTGNDPSGLFWSPSGTNAHNEIISMLSDFFDWLGENGLPRAKEFNPRYRGSVYDQKIDFYAYNFRRNKAFLGHTWSCIPERSGRVTRPYAKSKVFPRSPPAFPEERFEELLFKGFKVGGRYDYRGMAISCLLMGGGLRASEPFSMFMCDVQPRWEDVSIPFVAIHHPSDGVAPFGWLNREGKRGTRQEYLASEYALSPRTLLRGKKHAGWKSPALDAHNYFQVHWFPKERYGRLFFDLWKRYLERVASVDRLHPYAWVNLDRSPIGERYSLSSYHKALEAAVGRIGLEYGKVYGTTAHGMRHAYAQRARRADIPKIIIQRMMHHCCYESQDVYTQPEMCETAEAIVRGSQKLATEISGEIVLRPN